MVVELSMKVEEDMESGTQYEDSSSTTDDEASVLLLDHDELLGTAVMSAKLVK